jgi:hypothetical protein
MMCERCNKKIETGRICANCNSILMNKYNHQFDWETALAIETEEIELNRLKNNLDFSENRLS